MTAPDPQPQTPDQPHDEALWTVRDGHDAQTQRDFVALLRVLFGPDPADPAEEAQAEGRRS